jgi:hypothetical protein
MKALQENFKDGQKNASEYALSSIFLPAANGLAWAWISTATTAMLGFNLNVAIGLTFGILLAGSMKLSLELFGNNHANLSIIRLCLAFAAVSSASLYMGIDEPLVNSGVSALAILAMFPQNISKLAGVSVEMFSKIIDKIILKPAF